MPEELDQVEIEQLIVDLPDGEDPDLANEIARELMSRLTRLIAEV